MAQHGRPVNTSDLTAVLDWIGTVAAEDGSGFAHTGEFAPVSDAKVGSTFNGNAAEVLNSVRDTLNALLVELGFVTVEEEETKD